MSTGDVWKMECFVPDKNVTEVLRRMHGVALHPGPTVTLVTNAKAGKKGLVAKSNGELVSMFAADLAKSKPSEITTAFVRDWQKANGQPLRPHYLLKKSVEKGLLKRIGKPGGPGVAAKYRVVTA
jgi:hypothetical protein